VRGKKCSRIINGRINQKKELVKEKAVYLKMYTQRKIEKKSMHL
jgi:hypothetical protein